MAGDVVTALPPAPGGLTRDGGDHLPDARIAHDDLSLRQLALASRPSEPAIDDGRTKEPLRDEDPARRNGRPAHRRLDPLLLARDGRVRQGEGEVGDRQPRPAALDEDGVEDVGLAGKVARREGGVLGVRLGDGIVGGIASLGREDGEDGAEDEDDGEQGEDYSLERRGQERRVAGVGARGRRASGAVGHGRLGWRGRYRACFGAATSGDHEDWIQ